MKTRHFFAFYFACCAVAIPPAARAVGSVNQGTSSTAPGDYATVSGGQLNDANAKNSTIGGGLGNQTDAPQSTIAGGQWNWVAGTANNAVIAGGAVNVARGRDSVIAGGRENNTYDQYCSVGGGKDNSAAGAGATVGGGEYCTANGLYSTIGGGEFNQTAAYSTVAGGSYNNAAGFYSAIPGGINNYVPANNSFAAGTGAVAEHNGCFVWADAGATGGYFWPFRSAAHQEFSVRCQGGARFVSAINSSGTPTAGVVLAAGGGSWSNLSDKNSKTNFAAVNARAILAALVSIPIQTWNYKSQDTTVRHIGPVAQDFAKAFGVGEDDAHINTVDADGVALAAIQGLHEELKLRDEKIAEQRTALDDQKQVNDAQQKMIDELRAKVEQLASQPR